MIEQDVTISVTITQWILKIQSRHGRGSIVNTNKRKVPKDDSTGRNLETYLASSNPLMATGGVPSR